MLMKITRHGQITLPKVVRERLDLAEGDYVEVEIPDDEKSILLKPRKVRLVGPDQEYYWSETWQAEEKEADEDIRNGRVRRVPKGVAPSEFLRRTRRGD